MVWVLFAVLCVVLLLVWLGRSFGSKDDPTGMVGLEGVAQEVFSREGMVFVRGELWKATAKEGIVQRGEKVVVTEVRPGLMLVVESVKDQGSQ